MFDLPDVLRPKWKLFQEHHHRLATRPEPGIAQIKFDNRILRSRRVGFVRAGFVVGLYFSFIAAATSFIVDYFNLADFGLLRVLKTVASSLTVVFVGGIFLTTRILSYLEIDMYFYSAETRLGHRGP